MKKRVYLCRVFTENPNLDSSYRDTDLKETGENDSVEDLNRSNILINNIFGY